MTPVETIEGSDRIAVLRRRLRERKVRNETECARAKTVTTAQSLRASEHVSSWQIRRGLLTCDRLASVRFDFDPIEMLVGRLRVEEYGVGEREHAAAVEYLRRYPAPPGQTGHCELDLSDVLIQGIDGVRRGIAARCEAAAGDTRDTYQSFLYVLDGLSQMIEHAAAAAESGPSVSASCLRVAHDPPQTFQDALHLLWLVLFGVMHGEDVGLVVPGHLDRSLYPFYESDRRADALSRDDALLLIENLYLLINDFIPDGLAMSVMVGGRNAQGIDVTNDLSYLCLEALRRTRLIYPTVGICWHEGTPPALIELAVDLIGHGNPSPAFFGDATIQRGLEALGVPPGESCHYINSTCVEITPARSSNVWVASPYFPLCHYLLDEIADQVQAGDAARDFNAFRARYRTRLGGHIADAVAAENAARRLRSAHGRKPLQSVFTRDCIARGWDIDDGGARYNWVECSFVGLANLADSLYVIREDVFENQHTSLSQLKQILDADFVGYETERRRFLRSLPKYGQGCADVDDLVADTVAFLRTECAKHRMEPDDSPFVPGGFCWVMHEVLGRACGATPDGRKAAWPFADGCGPAQGRETCGPTAAILSTTSWDHSPMIGGLAYNMKFSPSFFRSASGFAALRDLVLTFLRRGGFEIQVNVVNTETLKKARCHPEDYQDLVVRIGGYSDYFTRLSPEMQDEIILRAEFTGV